MDIREKWIDAMNEYFKKFNDYFPSMLFRNNSMEEMIGIINSCIYANKNVFDMGYAQNDDDSIY